MLITIAVAAAVLDGLAAYGTILRYGKHEKRLTACYPTASGELAMMEGVYTGLRTKEMFGKSQRKLLWTELFIERRQLL